MGKKLERASTILGKILKAGGMQARLSEYRIAGRWEKMVGPLIASHAVPIAIRGAKLFLTVDSAAWMQQLSMLKPNLIEQINQGFGKAVITDIVLKLGQVPSSRSSLEPPPAPLHLTPEEIGRIDEVLVPVHDPQVRRAIRRVMEKDILRKREKAR